MAENVSLGLSKQYGKKRLCGKSVLEENIRTVAFTTGEVCDCFALDFIPNLPKDKRVEQFCVYLLENYIDVDSTFSLPVWSECTASSLRTINACGLFNSHFNALFYSAHHNTFVLVPAL